MLTLVVTSALMIYLRQLNALMTVSVNLQRQEMTVSVHCI